MSKDSRGPEPDPAPDSGVDGFLGRWSRRKREAALAERREPEARVAEAPPTSVAGAPAAEPVASAALPVETSETTSAESVEAVAEQPAEPELPAIDSLDENSDYSAFMSPKVSPDLQRLALRKLFSAAVFNERDGLNEYDDDYTYFEPLGDVVTADMKHQTELEEARSQARQLADAEAAQETADAGDADATPASPAGDDAEPGGDDAVEVAAGAQTADEPQTPYSDAEDGGGEGKPTA